MDFDTHFHLILGLVTPLPLPYFTVPKLDTMLWTNLHYGSIVSIQISLKPLTQWTEPLPHNQETLLLA